MKKLFSIMAMVAVIFATSCQRVEDPTGLGTTSEVTFSVQSPDQLTRAIGDGSKASKLTVAVYDTKGNYLDKVSPTSPITGSKHWDVTLSLVDGMTYDIVFWAQADGAPYTLNQNDKTLTVIYENANAQDEKRDAFYAVVEDYEADGANTVAVKLTRPFAQLNIVTTDYTTAVNSGVNVTTTGLKVSNLPTTMDLLSGDVSGSAEEVVFSAANKPAESHPSFTNTSDVEYTWLSMNYVLASEEGDLISTVTLTGTTKEKDYRDIPVKRNFRTNIYGKILTSDVDFDVDTDQEFDGNEDIEVWDGESTAAPKFVKTEDGKDYYEINSPEQLAGMVQGVKADENPYYESNVVITLTKDIDLGAAYWTPIGPNADASEKFKGIFDGQGHTIYNLKVQQGAAYHAAGLFGALNGTVKNLVIENAEVESVSTGSATDNGTAVVAGSIYRTGTIDKVTVRNVKVKGNRYVGAIAGYAYGNITNCKVEKAELTATPDQCSGAYDNGDKVGAIAGYWASEGVYKVDGNTVEDVIIKGYRDIGGVIGCGNQVETLQNNNVNRVSLIIDQSTGFYGEKDSNAAAIIGRITEGQIGANNTSSEVRLEVIAQTAAPIAQALKAEYKAISVKLANDIDLPINSLGNMTSGSGEYKLGGENTNNITIDLNGNKLNVTTTYWSALGAKNVDANFTIKNGTMTSSSTSGTWNSYDLSFANCNYQIENVVFDKAVAFTNAGKAVTINGVTINETHDYYAMWISAEGQAVTIDGLTINSDGRGIKIDEQYVGSPAKVSMNISNAKFTTAKKAAILVKSVEGAEITWGEGNDISGVDEDKDFAVWVDEDAADYADKVVVNGALVKVEGTSSVIVDDPDEVNNAISTGGTVVLATDVTYSDKIKNDLSLYLNGNDFEATGTIELSNNANLTMIGGDYVVNSTYGHVDVRPSTAEGSVVVYENIDFSYNKLGPTYGPSTNRLGSVVEVCATVSEAKTKIKFKNCTFTNAQVLFEGLSGKTGEVDAVFENCTFNALTSSAPIYVQNYIKGSITVRGCTFNLECTSSTASAISVSSSTSTDISVTAENNTINATAAAPYTHDESKGETNVHDVKVNGTPNSIKFISAYDNTTIIETGTIKSGIAAN